MNEEEKMNDIPEMEKQFDEDWEKATADAVLDKDTHKREEIEAGIRKRSKLSYIRDTLSVVCIVGLFCAAFIFFKHSHDSYVSRKENEDLKALVEAARENISGDEVPEEEGLTDEQKELLAGLDLSVNRIPDIISLSSNPHILPEYREIYEKNNEVVGWLKIDGTIIDYPVLQRKEDEEFYIHHDFYGRKSANGCLVMDSDSEAGIGRKADSYINGTPPSTNIIIHGHHLIVKEMFADLVKYEKKSYGLEHHLICFDSLYERREYELISAFYSKVYEKDEDVFKYYNFFNAENEEEFDDFYKNIKKLSLYDTGVEASFGDEFITLSTCAYHTENGRFVVVGKRVK